ncbi:MAG: PAS domain S-box protein, partial [Alistipes sp.]
MTTIEYLVIALAIICCGLSIELYRFRRKYRNNCPTDSSAEMATLYQNEELLGAILDNMPTPVMVKDINDGLKYIFWNRHCEELCGQMREEIIGKTDLDIYGIERGSHYRKVDEALLAGNGTYSAQETFELADGLVHTTLVKKNVIANKSHRWLLVTRWDISDQVKVQNELREANEQLRTAFRATMSVPVQWDITTD